MNARTVYALFRDTLQAWNEDNAARLGAALAYYSVFSLAPLVLVAIGIAGLFFEDAAAKEGIVREIRTTVGEPAASAIEEIVQNAADTQGGSTATVLGLLLLVFGASGVFVALQDALHTIWRVEPQPERTWLRAILDRFFTFGIVLGAGFLLLVSLVLNAVLAALSTWLSPELLPGGVAFWQAVNNLVAFLSITSLFALIFKWLPDVELAWKDVWVGAGLTGLLFTLGKWLIGLYLGQSATTSAFGAAGSLVVILIWVYYSAQIVLFGAEFIRVYSQRFGSRVALGGNAVLRNKVSLQHK